MGLTRDELAARAGMSITYLQYLEESPGAVGAGTLYHLAEALQTTTAALLGAGIEQPPGQGAAGSHPKLETLGALECQRLLAAGGVGRVVFNSERGPVALPVNYRLDHDDVVFRTAAGSELAYGTEKGPVSFEVDHIDESAEQVPDEDGRIHPQKLAIDPWAGGERELYLRLVPVEMSGRRIRSGS